MARRKKFLRIRLPFINFRVKKDTFLNVIGIFIWTVALILFLSFFIPGGELLFVVSTELTTLLGGFAIIFPFLLALAGTHFFNSHRLQLVKLHVTIGLTFMFIAFLGVFRSGFFGQAIYESLVADFSIFGAIIILFVMFIVGIVLFFNTSVDAFLAIVMELFKFVYSFIQKKFLAQDKEEKLLKGPAGEFITDRKAVPQQTSLVHANKHDEGDLKMKPYKTTSNGKWEYPPLTILADISNKKADVGDIKENSAIIERTLDSFGIRARVVDVNDGPTVTQYALEIVMGTKLSKITALANDLALALAAPTGQVRIEAPIPGRALVGIEIPNRKAELVPLKKLLAMGTFRKSDKALWVPLGLDVTGKAQGLDITNMPHVLIAGTTGAGKSVLLNSWICTMLFRASPEEVRLILIDPKRVDLS
ncbi:MAG: DNA translocase FtsK, partial [Candidatus Paceibacterota bacterium]